MGHRPVAETRGKLLLAYAAPGTELTILQDKGPLELIRRQKVLGWDDEVESTKCSKLRVKTMKTTIHSKIMRIAPLCLTPQSTPCHSPLPP